jgi:hypothetical protein
MEVAAPAFTAFTQQRRLLVRREISDGFVGIEVAHHGSDGNAARFPRPLAVESSPPGLAVSGAVDALRR